MAVAAHNECFELPKESLEEFVVLIHEHVKLVESMASHSSVPPCFCHGVLTGGFIPCWDMLNGRSPLCEMDRVTRSSLAELGPRLREREEPCALMSASSRGSQDPVPLLGAEEDAAGLGLLVRGQESPISFWLLKRPLNESHDYSSCSSV